MTALYHNIVAFFRGLTGNFIIQLGLAWVVAYWLAVYAFTGPPVKQGTDWMTFVFAMIMAAKWAPNAFDGIKDQGTEGRGRLAIGFLLVFTYMVLTQLWVIYLNHVGSGWLSLDNSVSGFIKSIGLAGLIFCLFAETTAVEFTANRRWYRTAIILIIGILIGFAIRSLIGIA